MRLCLARGANQTRHAAALTLFVDGSSTADNDSPNIPPHRSTLVPSGRRSNTPDAFEIRNTLGRRPRHYVTSVLGRIVLGGKIKVAFDDQHSTVIVKRLVER